ncbi:MAG: adenosine kinase [Gammaproteobacteria bacterium]|nr:adenosine kinase [Gammaproteobacteria bacterium]
MYDVYGLGNALVDMEYTVEDEFLQHHGIGKGLMTLVDEERIDALTLTLEEQIPERMSGGSAANTIFAAKGFGATAYYSCKVGDDETGTFFLENLDAAGVATNPNAKADSGKSGRCLVLVTPDAERSMNTFLGISSNLGIADIDEAALAGSKYFYVEGYLSSSSDSLEAAVACMELAQTEQVETAVSLSDPSMVELFRDNLSRMLGNGVDHLFCNEEEALSWAKTDRLDIAINELKDIARGLNITLGARGSLAITGGDQFEATPYPAKVIDTNGAGDIYAGACLYGWSVGMEPVQAASFANFAAGNLVQLYGARFKAIEDYGSVLAQFKTIG